MTTKNRKMLRRKCGQAAAAQEKSAEYLRQLHEIYDPDYPDLALVAYLLAKSSLELKENIIRFRREKM